ncbi:MAG: hypothetical protein KDE33_26770 [Bacteroidetes bacterium]|nr:hypothetical protein [Bacteroidota bacterium]MCB9280935.1 hypothetical protein [Lewinellaceae bacterium]
MINWFQLGINACIEPITKYDGIVVLEFISWMHREKGVKSLQNIAESELVDYIANYLNNKKEEVSLENINLFLGYITKKNTVIEKAKNLFGLEVSKSLDAFYFSYSKAKYSSLILYPHEQRNQKIQFFKKYKKDLNGLTSQYLNIFYSENDTLNRSGYSILNSIGSLGKRNISLPAILIWDTNKGVNTADAVPILDLEDEKLFRLIEKLTFKIKKGHFENGSLYFEVIEKEIRISDKEVNVLKEVKGLVGNGDTKKALDTLNSLIQNFYPNKVNQIALLGDLRRRIKDADINGLIPKDEILYHQNRLNYSILNLVDEIIYS